MPGLLFFVFKKGEKKMSKDISTQYTKTRNKEQGRRVDDVIRRK